MLKNADLDAKLDKSTYKNLMADLDVRLGRLQRENARRGHSGHCRLRRVGMPREKGWCSTGFWRPSIRAGTRRITLVRPRKKKCFDRPCGGSGAASPPRGGIAFFNHSWYRQVVDERVEGGLSGYPLKSAYERIRVFERNMVDDGAVIVKFFLHISKKEQAKRFRKLGKDHIYAWRIGKAEKWRHKHYDNYCEALDAMFEETSREEAPWTVVPATDDRLSIVTVARTIAGAFERAPGPPRRVLERGRRFCAAPCQSVEPGGSFHTHGPGRVSARVTETAKRTAPFAASLLRAAAARGNCL